MKALLRVVLRALMPSPPEGRFPNLNCTGAIRHSVIIGLLLGLAGPAQAVDLRILIPLYSYPTWYNPPTYLWDDVAQSASDVPITTIINPNSGPGVGFPNSDYAVGIADLIAGGVKIIGYVHTSYGARDINIVKSEIDDYSASADVTGIFLDETSNQLGDLGYYTQLYAYVHAKPFMDVVVVNPGTQIPEEYISTPACDTAIVFENHSGWPGYNPDAYVKDYPGQHFAVLPYGIPDAGAMCTSVDLAVQRSIGHVYITDDALPNPWDSLPSYWLDLVDFVKSYRDLSASGIEHVPAGVELTFGMPSNRPYRIEYCTDVESNEWLPLTGNLTSVTKSVQTVDTNATDETKAYRLRMFP